MCVCVCVCVCVFTQTYLWGLKNNQHNRRPLFHQTNGVQRNRTGENKGTLQLMYMRVYVGRGVGMCMSTCRIKICVMKI